jgi:hypothetical protein
VLLALSVCSSFGCISIFRTEMSCAYMSYHLFLILVSHEKKRAEYRPLRVSVCDKLVDTHSYELFILAVTCQYDKIY